MHVDLGNVLDTTPGLTEETLDRLDSRVADTRPDRHRHGRRRVRLRRAEPPGDSRPGRDPRRDRSVRPPRSGPDRRIGRGARSARRRSRTPSKATWTRTSSTTSIPTRWRRCSIAFPSMRPSSTSSRSPDDRGDARELPRRPRGDGGGGRRLDRPHSRDDRRGREPPRARRRPRPPRA